MPHGVRSERSQIGRCKKQTLGGLKNGSLIKVNLKALISRKSRQKANMAGKQIPIQSIGPKIGMMMKQPTFDWGTDDKYRKLKNFKLEVINVLLNHMP